VNPSDIQTSAELKAELLRTAAQAESDAAVDKQALFGDAALPSSDLSAFDVAFEAIRQQVLSQMSTGADQLLVIALQEAVSLIDDLRALVDEIGLNAIQMGLAAASGVLIPPTSDDLDDYSDEVKEAQSQARLVGRDLANARARREAARTGQLVATATPTEREDAVDVNGSFVTAGNNSATRPGTSTNQAQQLQEMLRAPILTRLHYVAICTALAQLSSSRAAQQKAQRIHTKLKTLIDQIKRVLDEGFLGVLQDSIQERANAAVTGLVDTLQSKLDAIDAFTKTIAGLPGALVSTVSAIGDIGDQTPLLNSLGTLCGIKGSRFCDFQGLLDIASSLDGDLGLKFPKLPMVGRIQLALVVSGQDQVATIPVIPGQQAELILVEASPAGSTQIKAKFSGDDRPTTTNSAGGTSERPDAFGNGAGSLTLRSPGASVSETVRYTSVTFSNGVYTFNLATPLASRHAPWMVANTDTAQLAGWNDDTRFLPGSQLRVRMPTSQRQKDLVVPSSILIGGNETWSRNGTYKRISSTVIESTTQNTSTLRTFRSWHIGQRILVNGAAMFIDGITDGGNSGYDRATLSASISSATTGSYSINFSSSEIRDLVSVNDVAGSPQILQLGMSSLIGRDHQRLVLSAQKTLRVVPDAVGAFLSSSESPANPNVRTNTRTLPVGSTVVRGRFLDSTQAAIFTPIITGLGSGSLTIAGGSDLSWSAVVSEPDDVLRFTLSTPTTVAAEQAAAVEVETTSMLTQFSLTFDMTWSDPLDNALRQILVMMNRIESQFCKLLSGSSQEMAGNMAILAAGATAASLSLTATRFMLVAWLAPLLINNDMSSLVSQLQAMGAVRAAQALREGRVEDFVAMKPSESTQAGASETLIEELRGRLRDENEYAAYAAASAQVSGQHNSVMMAGAVTADIKIAQRDELQRREQAARNLRRLAEDIPV
jgi:hypothetical protein